VSCQIWMKSGQEKIARTICGRPFMEQDPDGLCRG
jgi:hypothetical protein